MKTIRNAKGFTMFELLLGLVITAMLFTALAVVFDASAKNFTQNEKIYTSTNMARQALVRITNQLRTAKAVSSSEANSQCSIITSEGQDVTYLYDSDNKQLLLITNGDETDQDYVLCRNVANMSFNRRLDLNSQGLECVKDVRVAITIEAGEYTKSLASAVLIRKNL